MSVKKKVIFCTYSSIYSSKVLKQLVDDDDIEIQAIINSTRVLRPSLNPILGAIYQLKTSGLRYSAYLFFITDLFHWIQSFLMFNRRRLRSIYFLARDQSISIMDTRDINSTEIVEYIKKSNPDYILCAHFNQLLKAPILNLKDVECINIHPSLLPNYKGVDPVFFAMRDNVKKIGVTVHRMNPVFDSGEILQQSEIKLNSSRTLLLNNCELFEEGVKLAINWMKAKKTPLVKQIDNSLVNDDNYDSWPTRTDIKQFKRSGHRLMNLSALCKHQ